MKVHLKQEKIKKLYDDIKLKQETLLSIERSCDEFISQMLNIIESNNNIDDSEVLLVSYVFPSFIELFNNMQQIDEEYSYHCINNYILYIKGPKNRPTRNNYGLLTIILQFLEQTYNNNNNLSSFGYY